MNKKHLLLPSLALGSAALLLGPAPSGGSYSLIGDSLSLAQRDVRVFNNFTDAAANDNVTPDDNFPGWDGAEMAIWKACAEWGSTLHGSGNGDPTQHGGLGSGGANFDASFQGSAGGVGSSSNNIHSEISGSAGGVLAYCESGSSGAWRIRYYENWTWQDGPSTPGLNQVDLQGVACHEYGHALGLGHSSVGLTTMFPTISGTGSGQRSIEADDVAGLKAIYGTASGTKPRIFDIDVSGATLTVHGEDFSSSNNQVWFTNETVTSTGTDPFVKVTGVSSTGGGTQIVVNVPASAGPGDVFVQKNSTSSSALSNGWPFDPAGEPAAPVITGIEPATIAAVLASPVVVTLSGNGLETVLALKVGGAPVEYALSPGHELSFTLTSTGGIGSVPIEVETLYGTGQTTLSVVANEPPVLVIDTPLVIPGQQAHFTIGGEPGEVALLAASPHQIPSVLPGVVAADIGFNFTSLTLVGDPTIGASGIATVLVNTGGLPTLSQVFFQAAVFDGTFPLVVTEVAQMVTF